MLLVLKMLASSYGNRRRGLIDFVELFELFLLVDLDVEPLYPHFAARLV